MQVVAVLVEDNIAFRKHVIPAMKEIANIEVIAFAEDADGAQHLLAREDCHLVVVDLHLRAGSGLDVLAGIRSANQEQSVFMLTSEATDETRRQCMQAGATAVFDKVSELDPFFARCLDLSQQRRESEPSSQVNRPGSEPPLLTPMLLPQIECAI